MVKSMSLHTHTHASTLTVFRGGMNKFAAQLFVFFVSALAHEVVVSGPLCTFNILQLHSFYGMMVQPLFVVATMKMHPRAGNMFVWLTIMIGQPLGVIFYYRDYVSRNALVHFSLIF